MRKRIIRKSKLAGITFLVAGMLAFTGCGAEDTDNTNQVEQEGNGMVDDDLAEQEGGETVDVDSAEQEGDGAANADSAGQDEKETGDAEIAYDELEECEDSRDFSIELLDGSTFNLSDYLGKVVVLNFWATWCDPCVEEMPAFQKLQEEYEGQEEFGGVIAVNCMEDEEVVRQFVEENGYTFPIAADENGELSKMYPSDGIPYTLFIRQDGVVNNIYVGEEGADMDSQYALYKETLDAILYE